MLRRAIPALLTCAAVLLTATVQAKTLNISLILSDNSPPYRQFADSFGSSLAAGKADVSIVESPVAGGIDADLIIAVGMKAAELSTAQTGTPVLVVMIPKAGYDGLPAQTSPQKITRAISAIYLDQPIDRQLDFLHAALANRHRIGLLYSPGTHLDLARMSQDIARRGGSLVAQPVHSVEKLFSGLESVLADSDVLLAVPDSLIYSSSNIRNILLTSYRHRVPLIGLSQSYVNAGALYAIFSTPEQLAEQASSAVIMFARTRQLPDPQYPATFTIAVNPQVARSLDIELPSPEAIRHQMESAKEVGR